MKTIKVNKYIEVSLGVIMIKSKDVLLEVTIKNKIKNKVTTKIVKIGKI